MAEARRWGDRRDAWALLSIEDRVVNLPGWCQGVCGAGVHLAAGYVSILPHGGRVRQGVVFQWHSVTCWRGLLATANSYYKDRFFCNLKTHIRSEVGLRARAQGYVWQ